MIQVPYLLCLSKQFCWYFTVRCDCDWIPFSDMLSWFWFLTKIKISAKFKKTNNLRILIRLFLDLSYHKPIKLAIIITVNTNFLKLVKFAASSKWKRVRVDVITLQSITDSVIRLFGPELILKLQWWKALLKINTYRR